MTRDEKPGIPEFLSTEIQAPFPVFSASGFLNVLSIPVEERSYLVVDLVD